MGAQKDLNAIIVRDQKVDRVVCHMQLTYIRVLMLPMLSTLTSDQIGRSLRANEMFWRIFSAREFPRFAAEWNALNALAGNLPFLRSEFLVPALEEFGDGKKILAVCGRGGAPIAMALLRRVRPGMWQTFQPSQLPLGAFLIRPGEPFQQIVDNLIRSLPDVGLSLAVTQQDPDIVPRPNASGTMEILNYIDTARVNVADSFDKYWATRGKNLRQNVKRQKVKLREDGIAVRLELLDRPGEVAGAITDYGRLESAGWKAQEGTAVSSENVQGRFYRRVMESFCHMGAGRIYRYSFGERVVAMDLCLESPDVMVILKTAYDESVKSMSPATLMRHEYFHAIFDEKRFSRIEFFGKVMDWHLRWTDQVRTLYHANCFRWAWSKKARDILR